MEARTVPTAAMAATPRARNREDAKAVQPPAQFTFANVHAIRLWTGSFSGGLKRVDMPSRGRIMVAARGKFIEWVTMINVAPCCSRAGKQEHVDDGGPVGSSGFQWVHRPKAVSGDGRAVKGHALLFATPDSCAG
jgi:hypothetical protein